MSEHDGLIRQLMALDHMPECEDAADALAALVRERDEARAEAGRATRDYLDRCQAVERLTADLAAARAQVATLRDGLSKIARYRAECLAYDADTGREPRAFDKEDVRLIEGMARSLLSHVGATAPAERINSVEQKRR